MLEAAYFGGMRKTGMPIETMAFILGGIFIGVALLGGGIEIRELKIPPVGQIPRVLSMLAGLGFVGLAVMLDGGWPLRQTGGQAQALGSQTQTFFEPMYGDFRLDNCYEFSASCGELAASASCRSKGFKRAIDFPTENVGTQKIVTKLIGTQALCSADYCTAFISITCQK